MKIDLNVGLQKKFTLADEARERFIQRMLADGPVDLGFREWAANIIELSSEGAIKAEMTAVNVNGTPKLAFVDNGKGMPPTADDGKISLDVFTSQIGIGDELTKDNSIMGNQNRGFRYSWTSASPLGIVVYSKQHGQPCYRAMSAQREGAFGQLAPGVEQVETPEAIGDQGTMVVILGREESHNTAVSPFLGAEDFRKGAAYVHHALLTRRFWSLPDNVTIDIDRAALLRPESEADITKLNKTVRPLSYVLNAVRTHTVVKGRNGIKIHYIDRRHKRFMNPDGSMRGTSLVGGVEIGSFGAVVYKGEIYQLFEGSDADDRQGWKTYGAYCGIGTVGDRVSIVVELPDEYPCESSYDRRTLEWTGDLGYRTYKDFGPRTVALRAFQRDIQDNRPLWLVRMIDRDNDDDDNDNFKEDWQRQVEKLKLEFLMPGVPSGPGPDRFQFLMPMPLKAPGTKDNSDPSTGKGRFDPKSKNRVIGHVQPPVVEFEGKDTDKKDRPTMHPVRWELDYDEATHGWSCTIYIREDSRYFGMAMRRLVDARGHIMDAVMHPKNEKLYRKLRNLNLRRWAREVFGQQYMWAVFHANETGDPDAILDWFEDDDGRVAAQTMGHFNAWFKLIDQRAKSDDQTKQMNRATDTIFLQSQKGRKQ